MKITCKCDCGSEFEFYTISVEFAQSDECKKWMAEHQPHTEEDKNNTFIIHHYEDEGWAD